MSDNVVRFIFDEHAVRGVWVHMESILTEVLQRSEASESGAMLLGEGLAAAAMLSCNLKLQGRVALQARGDGDLKLLVAESTQDAGVRGVITLAEGANMAGSSLAQLVGKGYLAVTLLPDSGESYQGIVPLQGERLQDCLADYFVQSEQLPTALWLVCDGTRAAGLLLQALPSQDDALGWEHLHTLASTVTDRELLELPCDVLLHRLFHQEVVRVFPDETVRFQCTCGDERSRHALAVLGRDELHKLFAEQDSVTVDCHFCGAQYRYTAQDMSAVMGDTPAHVH